MTFGEYLKAQRDARGWTQPMAAEKIGIEQSYLSKLETGKAVPSEEMFERLLIAYGIDLDRMAGEVSLGELERLREIAAVRDLVRRGQQATAKGRRRWLMASLLLLAFGGALLSFVVTERRFADDQYIYVSKGVIQDGESDFLFGGFDRLDPAYITDRHADDPLVTRLDLEYRYLPDKQAYFVETVDVGRRVFEQWGQRGTPPLLHAHVFHALAVAMLLAGLGGLFLARRW
ncbi:MAG: helix-turn-helix transcriptional regulator [Pseudomonadota bacterium]